MRAGARDYIGDRYAAAAHRCPKRRATANLHALSYIRAAHAYGHAIPNAHTRPGRRTGGAAHRNQAGNES